MRKTKFNIEYSLKSASLNVLWNSIGTSPGLSEWFADDVTVRANEYVFCWERHEQVATLLYKKRNSHIRFQWIEDKDTNVYFELKIQPDELTGELTLVVTDFAEIDEIDDAILLWNKQIEELRRKTGM